MTTQKIIVREYKPEDAQDLANIYYHTIHQINSQHYTAKQVNVWAPESSLNADRWARKFEKTKPFIAMIGNVVVGFAEFEANGHIDCFYCHHKYIGCGVGSALMKSIDEKASQNGIARIFAEVSITARPFFEKHGFTTIAQQTITRQDVQLTNYKMEKLTK